MNGGVQVVKKKVIYLTQEGFNGMKEELESLRKKLMYDIAERIKEARELGDLSENSEYDEAKNEQGRIDSRIKQLEEILNNAEIIEDDGDLSTVKLGYVVELLNIDTNEKSQFRIVNAQEANIFEGKISSDSPIGRGVLTHKVNEVVRVKTPAGWAKYKILTIGK
ncbi:Transcription elongation factor greA [Mesotoga infera]|nr:Transcription elongation factor greA [Mesotoga infera]